MKPLQDSLTGKEFKAALKAVGLNQYRAAKWLGMGTRQLNRIAVGGACASAPLVKLLRLMAALDSHWHEADVRLAQRAKEEAELAELKPGAIERETLSEVDRIIRQVLAEKCGP